MFHTTENVARHPTRVKQGVAVSGLDRQLYLQCLEEDHKAAQRQRKHRSQRQNSESVLELTDTASRHHAATCLIVALDSENS